jgi:hypothetical protein
MKMAMKQELVDAYLHETRRNAFDPAIFLDWLKPRHNHPLHEQFWGMDDEAAAYQHRLSMVRTFVSGLRLTVTVAEMPREQRLVLIKVGHRPEDRLLIPAFVSDPTMRGNGPSYMPVRAADGTLQMQVVKGGADEAMSELQKWCDRYTGCVEAVGASTSGVLAAIASIRTALAAR